MVPALGRDGVRLRCGTLGARGLVTGAVGMARALGFSEVMIEPTIVAVGTSSPEYAATIVATLQEERDVAVGNLPGSSI